VKATEKEATACALAKRTYKAMLARAAKAAEAKASKHSRGPQSARRATQPAEGHQAIMSSGWALRDWAQKGRLTSYSSNCIQWSDKLGPTCNACKMLPMLNLLVPTKSPGTCSSHPLQPSLLTFNLTFIHSLRCPLHNFYSRIQCLQCNLWPEKQYYQEKFCFESMCG
jgi:hypothetical protein